ncbi:hypothetical protein [Meiothermus granaticius]|uniref:Uncharacterized protein n=1 Tax=Meiothermus granaticius NBRC 107808 TaxID=1227551 RepID=A0A399FFH5_9DEIN|nr:hypothetical protein [Meiothermus granaticius]RIH94042.1 hypothetical protein Mgrana_00129 [Meiothermus granaticius NBRC 107808]
MNRYPHLPTALHTLEGLRAHRLWGESAHFGAFWRFAPWPPLDEAHTLEVTLYRGAVWR